jgi:hypothetical protein
MKRNSPFVKAVAIIVTILFIYNDIAWGMAPGAISGDLRPDGPNVRSAMSATGQKLFAAKKGHGAIKWDAPVPNSFIGQEPRIKGVKAIPVNYEKIPQGWENNPLLMYVFKNKGRLSSQGDEYEKRLIKLFEMFRDKEARILAGQLGIIVGYFPVDEEKGELPIARIQINKDGTRTLVIHYKFAQILKKAFETDVWFEAEIFNPKTGGYEKRTVSKAFGIFERVAKHEMTDLDSLRFLPKSRKGMSHVTSELSGFTAELSGFTATHVSKDEYAANYTSGLYATINDGIWLWFLGSYAFANATRYDNRMFSRRISWFFKKEGKSEKEHTDFYNEFPRLYKNKYQRKDASRIAQFVNYHYFSRRDRRGKLIEAVNTYEISVPQRMVAEYYANEESVIDVLPATGSAAAPAVATSTETRGVEQIVAENIQTEMARQIRAGGLTTVRERVEFVRGQLWTGPGTQCINRALTQIESADGPGTLGVVYASILQTKTLNEHEETLLALVIEPGQGGVPIATATTQAGSIEQQARLIAKKALSVPKNLDMSETIRNILEYLKDEKLVKAMLEKNVLTNRHWELLARIYGLYGGTPQSRGEISEAMRITEGRLELLERSVLRRIELLTIRLKQTSESNNPAVKAPATGSDEKTPGKTLRDFYSKTFFPQGKAKKSGIEIFFQGTRYRTSGNRTIVDFYGGQEFQEICNGVIILNGKVVVDHGNVVDEEAVTTYLKDGDVLTYLSDGTARHIIDTWGEGLAGRTEIYLDPNQADTLRILYERGALLSERVSIVARKLLTPGGFENCPTGQLKVTLPTIKSAAAPATGSRAAQTTKSKISGITVGPLVRGMLSGVATNYNLPSTDEVVILFEAIRTNRLDRSEAVPLLIEKGVVGIGVADALYDQLRGMQFLAMTKEPAPYPSARLAAIRRTAHDEMVGMLQEMMTANADAAHKLLEGGIANIQIEGSDNVLAQRMDICETLIGADIGKEEAIAYLQNLLSIRGGIPWSDILIRARAALLRARIDESGQKAALDTLIPETGVGALLIDPEGKMDCAISLMLSGYKKEEQIKYLESCLGNSDIPKLYRVKIICAFIEAGQNVAENMARLERMVGNRGMMHALDMDGKNTVAAEIFLASAHVEIDKGMVYGLQRIAGDKNTVSSTRLRAMAVLYKYARQKMNQPERPAAGTIEGANIADLAEHPMVNALIELAISFSKKRLLDPYYITHGHGKNEKIYWLGHKHDKTFLDVFNRLARYNAEFAGREKVTIEDEIQVAKDMFMVATSGHGRKVSIDLNNINAEYVAKLKDGLGKQLEHVGIESGNMFVMKGWRFKRDVIVAHAAFERAMHKEIIKAHFKGDIKAYRAWRQEANAPILVAVPYINAKSKQDSRFETLSYNQFAQMAHFMAEAAHPVSGRTSLSFTYKYSAGEIPAAATAPVAGKTKERPRRLLASKSDSAIPAILAVIATAGIATIFFVWTSATLAQQIADDATGITNQPGSLPTGMENWINGKMLFIGAIAIGAVLVARIVGYFHKRFSEQPPAGPAEQSAASIKGQAPEGMVETAVDIFINDPDIQKIRTGTGYPNVGSVAITLRHPEDKNNYVILTFSHSVINGLEIKYFHPYGSGSNITMTFSGVGELLHSIKNDMYVRKYIQAADRLRAEAAERGHDGKFAAQPGKNPADALSVILGTPLLLENPFTLKDYIEAYEKLRAHLNFKPLAKNPEFTARMDLNALAQMGLLVITNNGAKGVPYIYKMSQRGIRLVADIKAMAPADTAPVTVNSLIKKCILDLMRNPMPDTLTAPADILSDLKRPGHFIVVGISPDRYGIIHLTGKRLKGQLLVKGHESIWLGEDSGGRCPVEDTYYDQKLPGVEGAAKERILSFLRRPMPGTLAAPADIIWDLDNPGNFKVILISQDRYGIIHHSGEKFKGQLLIIGGQSIWLSKNTGYKVPLAEIPAIKTGPEGKLSLEALIDEIRARHSATLGSHIETMFSNMTILDIDALCSNTPDELLSWHHFGKKMLRAVREALAEHGLCLKGDEAFLAAHKPDVARRPAQETSLGAIILSSLFLSGAAILVGHNNQLATALLATGVILAARGLAKVMPPGLGGVVEIARYEGWGRLRQEIKTAFYYVRWSTLFGLLTHEVFHGIYQSLVDKLSGGKMKNFFMKKRIEEPVVYGLQGLVVALASVGVTSVLPPLFAAIIGILFASAITLPELIQDVLQSMQAPRGPISGRETEIRRGLEDAREYITRFMEASSGLNPVLKNKAPEFMHGNNPDGARYLLVSIKLNETTTARLMIEGNSRKKPLFTGRIYLRTIAGGKAVTSDITGNALYSGDEATKLAHELLESVNMQATQLLKKSAAVINEAIAEELLADGVTVEDFTQFTADPGRDSPFAKRIKRILEKHGISIIKATDHYETLANILTVMARSGGTRTQGSRRPIVRTLTIFFAWSVAFLASAIPAMAAKRGIAPSMEAFSESTFTNFINSDTPIWMLGVIAGVAGIWAIRKDYREHRAEQAALERARAETSAAAAPAVLAEKPAAGTEYIRVNARDVARAASRIKREKGTLYRFLDLTNDQAKELMANGINSDDFAIYFTSAINPVHSFNAYCHGSEEAYHQKVGRNVKLRIPKDERQVGFFIFAFKQADNEWLGSEGYPTRETYLLNSEKIRPDSILKAYRFNPQAKEFEIFNKNAVKTPAGPVGQNAGEHPLIAGTPSIHPDAIRRATELLSQDETLVIITNMPDVPSTWNTRMAEKQLKECIVNIRNTKTAESAQFTLDELVSTMCAIPWYIENNLGDAAEALEVFFESLRKKSGDAETIVTITKRQAILQMGAHIRAEKEASHALVLGGEWRDEIRRKVLDEMGSAIADSDWGRIATKLTELYNEIEALKKQQQDYLDQLVKFEVICTAIPASDRATFMASKEFMSTPADVRDMAEHKFRVDEILPKPVVAAPAATTPIATEIDTSNPQFTDEQVNALAEKMAGGILVVIIRPNLDIKQELRLELYKAASSLIKREQVYFGGNEGGRDEDALINRIIARVNPVEVSRNDNEIRFRIEPESIAAARTAEVPPKVAVVHTPKEPIGTKPAENARLGTITPGYVVTRYGNLTYSKEMVLSELGEEAIGQLGKISAMLRREDGTPTMGLEAMRNKLATEAGWLMAPSIMFLEAYNDILLLLVKNGKGDLMPVIMGRPHKEPREIVLGVVTNFTNERLDKFIADLIETRKNDHILLGSWTLLQEQRSLRAKYPGHNDKSWIALYDAATQNDKEAVFNIVLRLAPGLTLGEAVKGTSYEKSGAFNELKKEDDGIVNRPIAESYERGKDTAQKEKLRGLVMASLSAREASMRKAMTPAQILAPITDERDAIRMSNTPAAALESVSRICAAMSVFEIGVIIQYYRVLKSGHSGNSAIVLTYEDGYMGLFKEHTNVPLPLQAKDLVRLIDNAGGIEVLEKARHEKAIEEAQKEQTEGVSAEDALKVIVASPELLGKEIFTVNEFMVAYRKNATNLNLKPYIFEQAALNALYSGENSLANQGYLGVRMKGADMEGFAFADKGRRYVESARTSAEAQLAVITEVASHTTEKAATDWRSMKSMAEAQVRPTIEKQSGQEQIERLANNLKETLELARQDNNEAAIKELNEKIQLIEKLVGEHGYGEAFRKLPLSEQNANWLNWIGENAWIYWTNPGAIREKLAQKTTAAPAGRDGDIQGGSRTLSGLVKALKDGSVSIAQLAKAVFDTQQDKSIARAAIQEVEALGPERLALFQRALDDLVAAEHAAGEAGEMSFMHRNLRVKFTVKTSEDFPHSPGVIRDALAAYFNRFICNMNVMYSCPLNQADIRISGTEYPVYRGKIDDTHFTFAIGYQPGATSILSMGVPVEGIIEIVPEVKTDNIIAIEQGFNNLAKTLTAGQSHTLDGVTGEFEARIRNTPRLKITLTNNVTEPEGFRMKIPVYTLDKSIDMRNQVLLIEAEVNDTFGLSALLNAIERTRDVEEYLPKWQAWQELKALIALKGRDGDIPGGSMTLSQLIDAIRTGKRTAENIAGMVSAGQQDARIAGAAIREVLGLEAYQSFMLPILVRALRACTANIGTLAQAVAEGELDEETARNAVKKVYGAEAIGEFNEMLADMRSKISAEKAAATVAIKDGDIEQRARHIAEQASSLLKNPKIHGERREILEHLKDEKLVKAMLEEEVLTGRHWELLARIYGLRGRTPQSRREISGAMRITESRVESLERLVLRRIRFFNERSKREEAHKAAEAGEPEPITHQAWDAMDEKFKDVPGPTPTAKPAAVTVAYDATGNTFSPVSATGEGATKVLEIIRALRAGVAATLQQAWNDVKPEMRPAINGKDVQAIAEKLVRLYKEIIERRAKGQDTMMLHAQMSAILNEVEDAGLGKRLETQLDTMKLSEEVETAILHHWINNFWQYDIILETARRELNRLAAGLSVDEIGIVARFYNFLKYEKESTLKNIYSDQYRTLREKHQELGLPEGAELVELIDAAGGEEALQKVMHERALDEAHDMKPLMQLRTTVAESTAELTKKLINTKDTRIMLQAMSILVEKIQAEKSPENSRMLLNELSKLGARAMELGAKGEDIEEITGPVGAAILSYIDYTINLMINKGPGAPGATRAELEALIAKHQTSIYKTVNLLHTSKVEVIMPNIAALADAVRTARDRANGNPSRENLKITMFQDAKDLEEILKRPNNGAQRIIVSFSNVERAVSEIQSLLSDESKSDLFKGVRSINLEAPENYDTITSEERSVWQWESIMTGWLARLYEPENKTPMIEAVLRVILTYQLKDADEARIQSFFNDLPEKPNETGREAVVRIKSCLNKIISFMKQTAQTLRMMAELSLYA